MKLTHNEEQAFVAIINFILYEEDLEFKDLPEDVDDLLYGYFYPDDVVYRTNLNHEQMEEIIQKFVKNELLEYFDDNDENSIYITNNMVRLAKEIYNKIEVERLVYENEAYTVGGNGFETFIKRIEVVEPADGTRAIGMHTVLGRTIDGSILTYTKGVNIWDTPEEARDGQIQQLENECRDYEESMQTLKKKLIKHRKHIEELKKMDITTN